jgi:hypothetical protein
MKLLVLTPDFSDSRQYSANLRTHISFSESQNSTKTDLCRLQAPSYVFDYLGRQQKMPITPEEKCIIAIKAIPCVKEFQIRQTAPDRLVFNVAPVSGFDEAEFERAREAIKIQSSGWRVDFQFADVIDRTRAEEYELVINEVLHA